MVDPVEQARIEAALTPTLEKLRWAGQHLTELSAKVTPWLHENPYEVRSEFYPEANVIAFYIDTPLPPYLFGIMAGNILYQLRSSLDHLIGQLAVACGSPRRNTHQFPIYTPDIKKPVADAADFDTRVKDGYLIGIRPHLRAAIEVLQPYHRQDFRLHPLAVLNRPSNTDKHNLLLPVVERGDADYPARATVKVVRDVASWEAVTSFNPLHLKRGAVVGAAEVVPSGPNPEMYMEIKSSRYIALDEGIPLGGGLLWLTFAVTEILTAFSPAIGDPDRPSLISLIPDLAQFEDPPKVDYDPDTEPLSEI